MRVLNSNRLSLSIQLSHSTSLAYIRLNKTAWQSVSIDMSWSSALQPCFMPQFHYHFGMWFLSILFVINWLPRLSASKQSTFQTLFNKEHDYQFLKIIGCECFPMLRPYSSHKLQPCSESCVFMGYSSIHKGYCCLHLSAC
jgi:hypothetical protein